MTSIVPNTITVRMDTFVIPYWGHGPKRSSPGKEFYLNLRTDGENRFLEVTHEKQDLTDITHKLNAVFNHKSCSCELYAANNSAADCWKFVVENPKTFSEGTLNNFARKMRELNQKILDMRDPWGSSGRCCREVLDRLPVPIDSRCVTIRLHTTSRASTGIYELSLFSTEDSEREDRQAATGFPICRAMAVGVFTSRYQAQCGKEVGVPPGCTKRMECVQACISTLIMTFLFPLKFGLELYENGTYWMNNWHHAGIIRRVVILIDFGLGLVTSPIFMLAYTLKCLFAAIFNNPELLYRSV